MTKVETGFADLNGAKVYYEVAGDGHPLLMLHAGIAHCRMWDDQFEVFAEKFRVVRYDLRGYGKTKFVAGEYAHRRDLYELLRHLGIPRAYLVGCSMGGRTIIDFALEHPEMVAALIPVGADLSGYQYTGQPSKLMPEAEKAFMERDIPRLIELGLRLWIDGEDRTPETVNPAFRMRAREFIASVTDTFLNSTPEQTLEPPAANRLSEIKAPTLVIYGDLDSPAIVEIAGFLGKNIAGAIQVLMSGTAHLPSMERPAEFNRHVLSFLNAL